MNFANWPAPQPLCLLLLTHWLSSTPEPGSLFFLSSPWSRNEDASPHANQTKTKS